MLSPLGKAVALGIKAKIIDIGKGLANALTYRQQGGTIIYTAMGGIGSDIAVDAADITLVNDDINLEEMI